MVAQRGRGYRYRSQSAKSASQRQGTQPPQSTSTVGNSTIPSSSAGATCGVSSSSNSDKISKSPRVTPQATSERDSQVGKVNSSRHTKHRSRQHQSNHSGITSTNKPNSQVLASTSDHVLCSIETESACSIHKLSVGQSQPEDKPLSGHYHPQNFTESAIKPGLITQAADECQSNGVHLSSTKMLAKTTSKRDKFSPPTKPKSSRVRPAKTKASNGSKDRSHNDNPKSRHPHCIPHKTWKRRSSCMPALSTSTQGKVTTQIEEGKRVKEHNGIGANVLVTFSPPLFEEISKENWEVYFGKFHFVIKNVCYFHPQEKRELNMILEFNSLASAHDAMSKLKDVFLFGFHQLSLFLQSPDMLLKQSQSLEDGAFEKTDTQVVSRETREIEPTIDRASFLEELEEKRLAYIENHKKEISGLKTRNAKLRKRKIAPDEIDKTLAEIELNKQKIAESDSRKAELLSFLSEMESEILLEGDSSSVISETVHASFIRECKRYERGLPIYAHRRKRLKTDKCVYSWQILVPGRVHKLSSTCMKLDMPQTD